MKKLILSFLLLSAFSLQAKILKEIKHTYQVKFVLMVPRVYNNTQSTGYRQYQSQSLIGELDLIHPMNGDRAEIQIRNLKNLTHTDSAGNHITYKCYIISTPVVCYIGYNATDTFPFAAVNFDLIAEPSYSISGEVTEDNSLHVNIAGRGYAPHFESFDNNQIISFVRGSVSGTIGCACGDYGHKSPTRHAGPYGPYLDKVTDIAPVNGQWAMSYLKTEYVYEQIKG